MSKFKWSKYYEKNMTIYSEGDWRDWDGISLGELETAYFLVDYGLNYKEHDHMH